MPGWAHRPIGGSTRIHSFQTTASAGRNAAVRSRLEAYFAAGREAFAATPPSDVVIDTERVTATVAAGTIARLVSRA